MISARRRAQFGLVSGSLVLLAAMSIVLAGSFEKPNLRLGQLGSPAATFRLPDARGNIVSLSALRGSVVVLYFAPAPDSKLVDKDLRRLAELGQRFASNRDVKLISIFSGTEDLNVTQSRTLEDLTDVAGPRCMTLHDPGYRIAQRYAIDKTSTFVVIDAGGMIRYRGGIDNASADAPLAATNFTSTIDLLLAERPLPQATPAVLSNIK